MGKLLTFLRTEIPSWQLFSEEAKTLFYTSTAEQFDTVNHFYLICLCIAYIYFLLPSANGIYISMSCERLVI